MNFGNIKFGCPHCEQHIEAPSETANHGMICPRCKEQIVVPPLRDRLEDIPALVAHYVGKLAAQRRGPTPSVSEEAMRFLKRHEWPGNVRELINALEYAVVTSEGDTIGLEDLPYSAQAPSGEGLLEASPVEDGHLARIEQSEIRRVLEQFGGNRTRAAEFLGINRKTLREKIRKYELGR